ncbi:uncharacterized protein L3040_002264 [Drepanopeziza brunnea f. sp. 'multigermtubi']|uniref:Survival factor 1 n=1 Tax=Marssonina brunnea f. sp. multigermtubi (strain MB_m1) TaxID=1072389 RepID=K1XH06_MARBU|nr:survival factor 1 [Drepanopeziza brunnea f. sp. 'multigermtubi' MB_m1]EKD20058.1 survival factor 1 [Drepanopeziza brunnea f. sp. 'multigermtubi' MB_m1]KAJ5050381.1 hypothetical protein L3040_002264 [Drepanopeziza brunnea f. sp. 'multigermtubi']
MMSWAQRKLADVAGTREPIYGTDAIQSVERQTAETPYTEIQREGFAWAAMNVTSVETEVFYLQAKTGQTAFVQVIHSNVGGLRTTSQFNCKIYYPKKDNKPSLWSSDQLNDVDFSDDMNSFYAQNLAVELSEDGNTYTIKSLTNEASVVNLTVTRKAPGIHVGKDGTSYFGTDPKAPWGKIRHAFWPSAIGSGTITTADGPIDFTGNAIFIHALQGMKPHHAGARWKFCHFQSENYSAIMMEFITPASYGNTPVTVGVIAKGSEIVIAGSSGKATWTKVKADTVSGWSPPEAAKVEWSGKTKDGKDVTAVIDTPLSDHFDRIDIMAEVPGFVKTIVAGAAGTRPYIYQYPNTPTSLKIKVGNDEINEQGTLYTEATFISE